MAIAQLVNAACRTLAGNPVAEDNVNEEERAIGKSIEIANGRTFKAGIGQNVDAANGKQQRADIARGAHAIGCKTDGTQKFDCPHGAKRQMGKRQIETSRSSRPVPRRVPPRSSVLQRSSKIKNRQGRRQIANMMAAVAMRSQATPSGSTRAKSSTAKAGPR